MFLLIDTSEYNSIVLTFFDAQELTQKEYPAHNRELLACIAEGLKEMGKSSSDIAGIAVVVGAGSFTSTRIAVTVANTFGYAQRIPLLAVTSEDAKDPHALLARFGAASREAYLSATYSADASITTPRPRG